MRNRELLPNLVQMEPTDLTLLKNIVVKQDSFFGI